jgi:myo-inositol-1(or 4)-monophosphatase
MDNTSDLLTLVKEIVLNVSSNILKQDSQKNKSYIFSKDNSKEVKAFADKAIEKEILDKLAPLGLPILSEESGFISTSHSNNFFFIVDPLDGTYNFVKNLGPYGISVALWNDNKPIFGVIYNLLTNQLIYGGAEFGSFCDDKKIRVSSIHSKQEASICTGFPINFNFEDNKNSLDFLKMLSSYAKVRMIGSAAISLANVGIGNTEVYAEKNIMLWDVAAGIAIVDGAGGKYFMNKTSIKWSYDVVAYNGRISI